MIPSFKDLSAGFQTLRETITQVRDFHSGLSLSLPEHLKNTNIMNRVYIQKEVAEEEIAISIMAFLNQISCGYVLTALQLNQYVSGNRTIRNMLELVSTEGYDSCSAKVDSLFGMNKEDSEYGIMNIHNESSSAVNLESKEQMLFSGRVIELELSVPCIQEPGRKQDVKIGIMVQLLPQIITGSVMKEFLAINNVASVSTRFRRFLAGEISFIADFLFERDLINNRKRALKDDRTNLLYDMLRTQSNALSRALMRYAGILPKNHNIANSIMIIDKNTFDEHCYKTGFDIKNQSTREKFFKETFIMLLVIVDSSFNRVSIYFNGLNRVGEYGFKGIQSSAAVGNKSDKFDLQTIMMAMSQGMTPRM